MLYFFEKLIDVLLLLFTYVKGRESSSKDILQDIADVKHKKDIAYSSDPKFITRVRDKYTRRN